MKKIITLIMLCIVGASFVSGCNTVQGIGKDVKKGGQGIERAAKY